MIQLSKIIGSLLSSLNLPNHLQHSSSSMRGRDVVANTITYIHTSHYAILCVMLYRMLCSMSCYALCCVISHVGCFWLHFSFRVAFRLLCWTSCDHPVWLWPQYTYFTVATGEMLLMLTHHASYIIHHASCVMVTWVDVIAFWSCYTLALDRFAVPSPSSFSC